MDYYKEVQYIAQVDQEDNVIGKVEKWHAHRQGILHRAFTVALFYKDHVILQHRKHPAFDGVFDVTFSSHQIYDGEKLQDDLTAIYKSLKREFSITEKDLKDIPQKLGSGHYRATDNNSEYIEHEMCFLYTAEVKELPHPNLEYAYGYSLMKLEDLKQGKTAVVQALAPWVIEFFKQKLI